MIAALLLSTFVAGDAESAKALEERAFFAVGEKRWCDAASLFQDAFDAEPIAAFLLNAAKAARSAEDYDLARSLATRASAVDSSRADEAGAILVELSDKPPVTTCPARLPKPAPPPASPAPTPPAPTPEPPPATTPAMTTMPAATTQAQSSPLFLAGAVTAGVGGALFVGAGGYAMFLEAQLNDVGHVGAQRKRDDQAQAAPVVAALLVGAATAAVGGVLIAVAP